MRCRSVRTKITVGGRAAEAIDIDASIGQNVQAAAALGRRPEDLTVAVLDQPRHESVKRSGRPERLKLIADGDVSARIASALDDTGIDLCIGWGINRRIIATTALRCLGSPRSAVASPRISGGCSWGYGHRRLGGKADEQGDGW
jgi:fructose-1,6-bisphosphatase II